MYEHATILTMLKALLKKWWFWVIVAIIVVLGALYLPWYIPWKLEQWGIERQRAEERAIWEEYEAQNEALREAYINDSYGGSTPEATLGLFVGALKKKDYELASKYFVIEKQEAALEENKLGESGGANQYLIDAYERGRLELKRHADSTKYTVELYPKDERIPFAIRFVLNPYSKKWKIVEL